jgi:hypothetical protein
MDRSLDSSQPFRSTTSQINVNNGRPQEIWERWLMGWTRLDKGAEDGEEENLLLTPFDDHSFEFRGVLFQHCWQICFIWNSGCFCWDCGVSQSDSEDDFCTENEFVQLCSTSIVCHLSNIILGLKWNQTWESTAGRLVLKISLATSCNGSFCRVRCIFLGIQQGCLQDFCHPEIPTDHWDK